MAGENIQTELRVAEGALDRIPAFAREIVELEVDVIAVIGAVTVRAVRKATTRTPIVFAVVVEPVGDGMAENLDRTGGNVTGVTTFDPEQSRIHMRLLQSIIPSLDRVAILSDLGVSECMSIANRQAAIEQGIEPQLFRVKGPAPDYPAMFRSLQHERAQALIVLEEPINVFRRKEIAERAIADRLPTLYAREQADAGGLIAYGTSLKEAARQMAQYVDKILKGSPPGILPVRAVLKPELVLNLTTARALGLTISKDLIQRADVLLQ